MGRKSAISSIFFFLGIRKIVVSFNIGGKKPSDIKDHKEFVKRNYIVQKAVNNMAAFRRDQIFGYEIQGKVDKPTAKQLYMRKTRLIKTTQGKAAVINTLFLQESIPPFSYYIPAECRQQVIRFLIENLVFSRYFIPEI